MTWVIHRMSTRFDVLLPTGELGFDSSGPGAIAIAPDLTIAPCEGTDDDRR